MANAFVPPGTSAKQGQEARYRQFAGINAELVQQLLPSIQQAIGQLQQGQGFVAEGAPLTQAGLLQMLRQTLQQGNADYGRAQAMKVQNTASDAALRNARTMIASMPQDPNRANALRLDALNQGNRAGANALTQYYDPATQQARTAQTAQTIGGLSNQIANNPFTQNAAALANILSQFGGNIYGEPQVKVGAGLGDVLGSVAGAWAGTGFKTS